MDKELNINSLTYIYDRKSNLSFKALDCLSLSFHSSEIIAITGETGSGKSTLMQNMDMLLIPTEGIIVYPNGIKIDRTPKIKKNGKKNYVREKKIKEWKEIRKIVSVSFQFPEEQIFKNTVIEDVMVGLLNFGYSKEEAKNKALIALKDVNLPENLFYKSPLKLSGGEKRKVVLAGTFALDPDFIILDEPTIGLDQVSSLTIMEALNKKHKEGTGIIIITHDMDFAYRYSERLIYLEKGKIIKDDKIENVFKDEVFIKEKGLNVPKIFECANYLEKEGIKIDYSKAKNIDDFISYLKEIKQ